MTSKRREQPFAATSGTAIHSNGFDVQFEISHEFDAPLDTLELAMMSPELGPLMGDQLESVESVQALTHDVTDRAFHRVWRFQGRAPLKILSGHNITREMMTWDEHSTYQRQDHSANWLVIPMGEDDANAQWRRHFSAKGDYRLDPLREGRTRRTVRGEMNVKLRVIGKMVERLAIAEVRKAYDAEADALRKLCTLP